MIRVCWRFRSYVYFASASSCKVCRPAHRRMFRNIELSISSRRPGLQCSATARYDDDDDDDDDEIQHVSFGRAVGQSDMFRVTPQLSLHRPGPS
ncbi:hypothetical protein HBI95_012720 [Parastagonospora nodorum]|nr:hypothetical protein HBI95_012720 [Parastagonospora nodorum]KAH6069865.1 hypothetical protein HBI66_130190 [Parastagonospora nodorum]KAH6077962.1 hypothetical protein HBI67_050810 [Parastagonospora nodorum]